MTERKVVWVVDIQASTYLDAQPLLATRNVDLFVLKPESSYLTTESPNLIRGYGAPHVLIQRQGQAQVDPALLALYPPPAQVNAELFRDATELITYLNQLFTSATEAADDRIKIDHKACTISFGTITFHLTPRELMIFETLYESRQNGVARDEFFNKIWGATRVCEKALDVHLSNLRKKVQRHGFQIRFQKPDSFVMTVPKIGAPSS